MKEGTKPTLKVTNRTLWSDKETELLFSALREHGKDYTKVGLKIPTKHINAILHKVTALKKLFASNPTLPGADLLPVLSAPTIRRRTGRAKSHKKKRPSNAKVTNQSAMP